MYHLMTIVVVDIMTIVVEIIIAAAMIVVEIIIAVAMIVVDMIIAVMVVVVAMTVAATVVMTVAAMIAVDERKFANDRFSQWIQDKHKLQIPEILAWKIQPWGCVFRPAA